MDDVLITGSSTELVARTKSDLKTRFEMTDSGKCAFVLGIELVDNDDGSVVKWKAKNTTSLPRGTDHRGPPRSFEEGPHPFEIGVSVLEIEVHQ